MKKNRKEPRKTGKFTCMFLVGAIILLNMTDRLPKNEQYIRSHVIQLESAVGMCTGVQVHTPKGEDLILSAAHCKELEQDGVIYASIDGGRRIPRHIVDVNKETDLMLVEGMPHLKGIEIASSAPLHRTYQAYTHGRGEATHRADGEYLEEKTVEVMVDVVIEEEERKKCEEQPHQRIAEGMYCVRGYNMVVTTIKVEPGSSGGPVVNDNDELVGIVSSSNSFFSNMVPLHSVADFIAPY